MSLLIAQDLAKRFGDQCVLEGVSLHIGQGDRIGLIGANGTGKSTLLNLLAGTDRPDGGRVRVIGSARLGYLTQESRLDGERTLYEELRATYAHLLDLERQIKALQLQRGQAAVIQRYDELHHAFETGGGYQIDSRIHAVLKGLGFSDEDARQPVAHLSGGQASRAALAKLLLEEPDLLLLDEPTNHLDADAVAWLEDHLSRWKRACVVSSHDRHLLDRLVTEVWAIHERRLHRYSGNYSAYAAQRAEEVRHQWEAYYAQQAYIQSAEDFISRNIVDKKTTKQAQARRRALEKLERVERPAKVRQLAFEVECPRASGQRVLRLQGVVVGYAAAAGAPQTPLFEAAHAVLERGERVALIGPNGCGKTTLLKTLTGAVSPLAGALEWGHQVEPAYFAQSGWDTFDPQMTLVDALTRAPGWTISRARDLLGRFLFSGDDVFKRLGQLSGGERSRVALARLAQLGGNLLLLDEPTNHLDIPARETLEQVLLDYPGTILFVSHDRYFVKRLATQVWEVAAGRLDVYKGGFDFFLEKRPAEAAAPASAQAAAAGDKISPGKRQRRRERERARLQRREAALADDLETLEAEIAQLERDLEAASHAQDLAGLQPLSARYRQAQERQAALLAEWERALADLEAFDRAPA